MCKNLRVFKNKFPTLKSGIPFSPKILFLGFLKNWRSKKFINSAVLFQLGAGRLLSALPMNPLSLTSSVTSHLGSPALSLILLPGHWFVCDPGPRQKAPNVRAGQDPIIGHSCRTENGGGECWVHRHFPREWARWLPSLSRWFWWLERTLHVTAAASYPHYECVVRVTKRENSGQRKLCNKQSLWKGSWRHFGLGFSDSIFIQMSGWSSCLLEYLAYIFCGCSHDLSGPFSPFSLLLSLELGQDHTPLLQKWPQDLS